jgi:hypothetical protein
VQVLDGETLAIVRGGQDASFGRCGPRDGWKWLGDVRTRECATHDAAVRGELANGTPGWLAHVKALPKLPAAVGSYVRAVATGS